ncbi:MAG: hypothetical protein IPL71_22965 [Anaerolineales bacterium]|uniref:hypothetical protein n=1 Tax=Candidatus Villigracilis proximus TaxID=3140683 RepID=UPI003134FE3F|nr:hypothetical protein [Anaerolineales bacterium]
MLSSLALAAHFFSDAFRFASTETAPVTSAVLEGWSFLPPPKPNIISEDSLPLEDRMTAIAQPQNTRSGLGVIATAS